MLNLNLLPPRNKQALQQASVSRQWMHGIIVLLLMTCIGTGVVIGTWSILKRHAQHVHATLETLRQQQAQSTGTDIAKTTSELNSTIKTLDATLGTPRSWAADTALLLATLPTGVTLSSTTMQANGSFHLIGIAQSRQVFETLDQALKSSPHLSKVNTTSTASKRTAVPFDYTGQIISAVQP